MNTPTMMLRIVGSISIAMTTLAVVFALTGMTVLTVSYVLFAGSAWNFYLKLHESMNKRPRHEPGG